MHAKMLQCGDLQLWQMVSEHLVLLSHSQEPVSPALKVVRHMLGHLLVLLGVRSQRVTSHLQSEAPRKRSCFSRFWGGLLRCCTSCPARGAVAGKPGPLLISAEMPPLPCVYKLCQLCQPCQLCEPFPSFKVLGERPANLGYRGESQCPRFPAV